MLTKLWMVNAMIRNTTSACIVDPRLLLPRLPSLLSRTRVQLNQGGVAVFFSTEKAHLLGDDVEDPADCDVNRLKLQNVKNQKILACALL